MEKKDISLVTLGVVAIIAIAVLIFLFSSAMTGRYVPVGSKVYATVDRPYGSVYGQGVPVYSDNCEELYGPGFTWQQGTQDWDPYCKPGVRTETWERKIWGQVPGAPGVGYPKPIIYENKGFCCPRSAHLQ